MDDVTERERVRVDIPDVQDPDFDAYHGREGVVVATLEDDADAMTGDAEDGVLYRVEFDEADTADFRLHDLRATFSDQDQ